MIGWVLLSRDQVNKAEEALKADSQGVLDEVGLLALHQGFADRFFPGTSVLHTRLRYALFVPWAMEDSRGDANHLREREVQIAEKLAQRGDSTFKRPLGIIGVEVLPQAPSQPPSTSYWGALSTWGLLRAEVSARSRAAVLKALAARTQHNRHQHKVDGELLIAMEPSPFVELPPRPEGWLKAKEALSFELLPDERSFLKRHWLGLRRAGRSDERSVLSMLAELPRTKQRDVAGVAQPWSPDLAPYVDKSEAEVLELAGCAARLACIARAVYATLVEDLRAQDGFAEGERLHRKHLASVLAEHGEAASQLDIEAVESVLGGLPPDLVELLRRTRDWVADSPRAVDGLWETYRHAECRRKGPRARLPRTPHGRKRRAEWDAAMHAMATPLHYRWPTVTRLLADLAGT